MSPLLIPLAALLIPLLKGAKTAEQLQYFPKNVEMINGKIYYQMDILNPTKNKLKVDSVFASIYANDKQVGTVERGTPFELDANKRTTVAFPIKLTPLGLVQLALSLPKLKEMDFKVAGVAKALGISNAISQNLNFGK